MEGVYTMSRSLLVAALLGAASVGISGCDDDDYYRHVYYPPPPPVVVQPPAASPPAYYAPPAYYYGGYGYGEHEDDD